MIYTMYVPILSTYSPLPETATFKFCGGKGQEIRLTYNPAPLVNYFGAAFSTDDLLCNVIDRSAFKSYSDGWRDTRHNPPSDRGLKNSKLMQRYTKKTADQSPRESYRLIQSNLLNLFTPRPHDSGIYITGPREGALMRALTRGGPNLLRSINACLFLGSAKYLIQFKSESFPSKLRADTSTDNLPDVEPEFVSSMLETVYMPPLDETSGAYLRYLNMVEDSKDHLQSIAQRLEPQEEPVPSGTKILTTPEDMYTAIMEYVTNGK